MPTLKPSSQCATIFSKKPHHAHLLETQNKLQLSTFVWPVSTASHASPS